MSIKGIGAATRLALLASLGVALVLVAQTALAQAPSATVTVKIKHNPSASLSVAPRGVGICKKAGDDCLNEVTWQTGSGSSAPQGGEYIVIRHKSSNADAAPCFTATTFRLDAATSQVMSGAAQEACPAPTAWFYSVELWSDNGTPKDSSDDHMLCSALDPGIIIDVGGGMGP
jgi:hypothetical protein